MAGAPTKLFVGNLPSETTDVELHTLFEKFGQVKEVHVMSSARSRLGFACAFVVCVPGPGAARAVQELNGVHKMNETDTQAITVSYARTDEPKKSSKTPPGRTGMDNNAANVQHAQAQQLYAAQLAMMQGGNPFGGTDQATMFNLLNTNPYTNPYANPYANSGAYPMGFGMGLGADAYDPTAAFTAQAALANLNLAAAAGLGGGSDFTHLPTQLPTMVAPSATPGQSGGTKLFVGGLPPQVQESEVRMVFAQSGTVKEVHVMQGRSQSGQACAFVVYTDPYAAQLAVKSLDKTPWHSAPDQPPVIVRNADKPSAKKSRGKKGGQTQQE